MTLRLLKIRLKRYFAGCITTACSLYYLKALVVLFSRGCYCPSLQKNKNRASLASFTLSCIIVIFINSWRKVKYAIPQTSMQCRMTVTSNPISAVVLLADLLQKSPLAVCSAMEMTIHFSHSSVADWLLVTPTMCFCLRGAHPCAKPYYAGVTEGWGGVIKESGSCNLEIILALSCSLHHVKAKGICCDLKYI